jgi:hypothetical protein
MILVNELPRQYAGEALKRSPHEILVKLPSVLRDFLAYGEGADKTTDELLRDGGVLGRYKALWAARARLYNIAQLAEQIAEGKESPYSLIYEPIDALVIDWIDSDGRIRPSVDLFAEATAGLPARKIRICKICQRIFWAARKDAQQCGDPKCKSAWGSRLSRTPEMRKIYYAARKRKRKRAKPAPKR